MNTVVLGAKVSFVASKYFPSLSRKQVNFVRNNSHVLDLTSHPALDPCPVKLGREPKWRYFDGL